MTVALATSSLGVRASTGPRRLGLAVVVIVLILALLSLGGDVLRLPPDQIGHRLKEAPVLQALVLPLRWFIDAFQASRLWPDLTVAVAKCLGVLGILLLAVFGLDAHYLETAAAASERNYARLQRARSGGAAASLASGGKPRFGLPDLPYLGGVGPVLWRQLTAVLRSARGLIIFLTLFGGAMVAPAIIGAGPGLAVREAAPALVGTLVGMTVMVLMPMIPYDFRGDLDRFEVLKTLPAHSLALAVGQLLAPTLVLCVVQAGLLVAMQWLWGGGGRALWVVALLGPPFNFLAVGLENLLFLWFPSRLLPTAPGDFQMMGRQMLLFWAKLLVLGTTAGLTAGLVAAVYLTILPVLPLALMVGWLPLGVAAGGLVPFVAMAFRRFDVARDTPP
jgi:hypothetical protein